MLLPLFRLGRRFLLARPRSFSRYVSYVQGQSPEPRIREYFYYIDHQGQLFLDDTKVKNFITCFKDKQFLVFFFKQLRKNSTGRYQEFPYVSPCGRERNFVRCDDLPVVFTHLMKGEGPEEGELLSYGGAGDKLAVRFEPERLFMPENGRVYHPAPERSGSIGLVKSSLAFELSGHFEYTDAGPESGPPSHFHWNGQRHKLTNELSSYIQNEKPT
ncbi:UPF0598 protein C8orf82 homolog isoform X2 [Heptranchias perlo]|uniref:UPF0598 protein C8orf82 homolog isoform X2 n=1 Tax=Heptranchias perlo TaxID=212740 RepID=UPI00355959F8